MDIVTLFYDLDKFAVGFQPRFKQPLLEDAKVHRDRPGQMCLSEIMTIQVLFHNSNYRTFKQFYLKHVCVHLRGEFPRLLRVAVGTALSGGPPHRSVLAALPHTALTSGGWRKSERLDKGAESWARESSIRPAGGNDPS